MNRGQLVGEEILRPGDDPAVPLHPPLLSDVLTRIRAIW
jgi:hypothetical protein